MAHPTRPLTDEARSILERLREICLALPGAEEKLAWGEPTFRAGRMFAMLDNDHHQSGHVAVWIKSTLEEQQDLVADDPERYFVPPYQGSQGWVGIRLDDASVDWGEVEAIIEDGYRLIASKRLLAKLDATVEP